MISVHRRLLVWVAVCLLATLRLAHVNLLWSDEDYHLAAALQILDRRVPYRDFWYDKPPMAALFYLLCGAHAGWALRLLDVGFVLACCGLAYKLAATWWGEPEGEAAAFLLAFFTTFYLPAATIPFAVDGLLLLPHLAAIYFAYKKDAIWSGVFCGLGLLTNLKAIFVTATCAIWLFGKWSLFATGLAMPLGVAAAAGGMLGSLPDCYRQVWAWGITYAKGASIANPVATALKRCGDWLGFHAALVVGTTLNRRDWFRLSVWIGLSVMSLVMGNHFAPRYFFQILPPLVIAGAAGMVTATRRYGRRAVAVFAVLLLIPMLRFGPRYGDLMADNLEAKQTKWSDVALDVDSQQVANVINARKHGGDSLFVWGYRPDIYVYTRLIAPGKFWDSQPLDGVPADRHLQSTEASEGNLRLEANRRNLAKTRPTYVVDGLGLLNSRLQMDTFPELREWLTHYRQVEQTKLSRVYELVR